MRTKPRRSGWSSCHDNGSAPGVSIRAQTINEILSATSAPLLGMDSHRWRNGNWIGDCKADGLQRLTIMCAKIKERRFSPIGWKYETKLECWNTMITHAQ
jgi:hypothetical protein